MYVSVTSALVYFVYLTYVPTCLIRIVELDFKDFAIMFKC